VPDYTASINYFNLSLAFIMVLIIAGVSCYIGVKKVIKVEPFDIFRG
jgi:putative ABC transport system permease protein